MRTWRGIDNCVAAALLAAAALGLQASDAGAEDKPLAELSSVLGELRHGGFVIYFRHAATEQTGATDEASDLSRCETQRNLSAEGRAQAAQIGEAIRALGIPVGTVAASPFCRTRDTAQLAFGRVTVNKDLYFVISTDAGETKRLAASLRQMLSTLPAKGTNAVLVSHSANLLEAAGVFAKPEGAAFVFRPLPDGKFEAVARILPEDWSRVAKLDQSASSRQRSRRPANRP
jgi:phosphohistidine phosphatase SixA